MARHHYSPVLLPLPLCFKMLATVNKMLAMEAAWDGNGNVSKTKDLLLKDFDFRAPIQIIFFTHFRPLLVTYYIRIIFRLWVSQIERRQRI